MADPSTAELVGQTVVNVRGDKVGKIDSIARLGDDEQARWACLKYGPLRMRCTYVPLHDAVRENGHVRVPYETEIIRGAPDVEADGETIAFESGTLLHRHFGLEPLEAPAQMIDDEDLELPRKPREAKPPAMDEGPDSPLNKRRRERARELGVPQHD